MSSNTRFRYALEPVLLIRRWDVDALMMELMVSNQDILACKKKLQGLVDEAEMAAKEWTMQMGDAAQLNVGAFNVVTRYLGDLAKKKIVQSALLEKLEQEHVLLTDRIAVAQRGLDAVEEHRDRKKLEFTNIRLVNELKNTDDQWSIQQSRISQDDDN